MIEELYKIKITGPNLEFETDVDNAKIVLIINYCLGTGKLLEGEKSIDNHVITSDTKNKKQESKEKIQSLAEFYNTKNPTRFPDKILVFAYYISEIKKKEDFSIDDIKPCFRICGEKAPTNIVRDFKWAITNGWIAEGESGLYYLTQTGKRVISLDFDSEIISKTKARRSTKKKVNISEK